MKHKGSHKTKNYHGIYSYLFVNIQQNLKGIISSTKTPK